MRELQINLLDLSRYLICLKNLKPGELEKRYRKQIRRLIPKIEEGLKELKEFNDERLMDLDIY